MVVTAPLDIRLVLEDGLRPESIRVDADFTDTEGARTDPHLSPPGTPAVLPLNAFLIVNGHTHFPLGRPIINIGRNLENHLVLDDVMVSRRHAQLRARDGRYLLTDLGSKHGTRVNNRIVEDDALIPGDVIRIGTTELIYGDDSIDHKTIPLTKTRSEHGAKP